MGPAASWRAQICSSRQDFKGKISLSHPLILHYDIITRCKNEGLCGLGEMAYYKMEGGEICRVLR